MKTKTNPFMFLIFCVLIGVTAGAVVWVFLKVMSVCTQLLWEWIPKKAGVSWYPLIVCVVGALIIGILRKKFGDYPDELDTVISKVKTEKSYDYRKMPLILIMSLIPLLIGSSVGPEAGLVGIIVALCYWAGDNLKYARHVTKKYTEAGMAVILSVLFHVPLFGIFSVEETEDVESISELTKGSKILIYGIATAGGVGIYTLLSYLFGAGLSGFPSFAPADLDWQDYALMLVYILVGTVLGMFYNITHKATHLIGNRIPDVFREVLAGLCIGIAGMFAPVVMFSGEEQMSDLMENPFAFIPIALIGIAFLKIIITNICIQFGLKGGHFFPVIYAGVCMGYGIATLIFGGGEGHQVFAAAVVTAALLGCSMKKPLAVTLLLFICFPIRMGVWIFLAAVIGSMLSKVFERKLV